MHNTATKGQPSQRQKNGLTLHKVFSQFWCKLHTGFGLTEQGCQTCQTHFHINANTLDILPGSKNWRQEVSLKAFETASQCYQGAFCSAKALLCHMQPHSPLPSPDYTIKTPEKQMRLITQGNNR